MLKKLVSEKEFWSSITTNAEKMRRKNDIIVNYLPLIKYVATKLVVKFPNQIELDDLISYGYYGLIDAVNKFDLTTGVKFKTYATIRIRGSIFDELRKNSWLPRTIRSQISEYNTTIEKINSLGLKINSDNICNLMGISQKKLSELYEYMQQDLDNGLSIYSKLNSSDDEVDNLLLTDCLASSQDIPEQVFFDKSKRKELIKRILKLSNKEKKIIILYYYQKISLKDIGYILNVCESRISQIHTKAVEKLKLMK